MVENIFVIDGNHTLYERKNDNFYINPKAEKVLKQVQKDFSKVIFWQSNDIDKLRDDILKPSNLIQYFTHIVGYKIQNDFSLGLYIQEIFHNDKKEPIRIGTNQIAKKNLDLLLKYFNENSKISLNLNDIIAIEDGGCSVFYPKESLLQVKHYTNTEDKDIKRRYAHFPDLETVYDSVKVLFNI